MINPKTITDYLPSCEDYQHYLRELDRLRAQIKDRSVLLQDAYAQQKRLREEMAKRQWQPIETAPKDGDTNFIIGCFGEHSHGEQFVVFYDEHPDQPGHPWQTADGIAYHRDLPTHWMPLPDPPKETEG